MVAEEVADHPDLPHRGLDNLSSEEQAVREPDQGDMDFIASPDSTLDAFNKSKGYGS